MHQRRSRDGRGVSAVHPRLTVMEYTDRDLLDSERFQAIPRRRPVRNISLRRAIPQENRADAWRSRWCHAPKRTLALPDFDLMHVHGTGKEQCHAKILQLFGSCHRSEDAVPHVPLVRFPRPLDRW